MNVVRNVKRNILKGVLIVNKLNRKTNLQTNKGITKEMKALKVTYSRLVSKGNYENAKIEIELEVEQGEKAADVYEAAKNWIEKRIEIEKLSDYTIEKAKKVMDDKRNHTLAQIEEAEEILSKVKVQDDELPF